MTRQHSVMMSEEVLEMEMMDRQFNKMSHAPSRGGGDMFSRRMETMDRFSNPWDSEIMGDRFRGGMRGGRGRGVFGGVNMSRIDPAVGFDRDYINYNDGGFSNRRGGAFGGGGFGNRSSGGFGNKRGGLGSGQGMGRDSSRQESINPEFDSLYEPEFKESSFERARAKLNSNNRGGGGLSRGRGGGRGGSYRGPNSDGPPKKTWSN